jgi:nucleotide-binding universal stress UspA family protein
MNRLHMSRRFPITLASLVLLALPIGCGSDTKTTVEVPSPPTVVADAPVPTMPPSAEMPGTVDQAVYQTAGEVKAEATKDAADVKKEVRDAEGDVKKAVDETEDEAKRKAQELEAAARKSAEDALNNLLPAPK